MTHEVVLEREDAYILVKALIESEDIKLKRGYAEKTNEEITRQYADAAQKFVAATKSLTPNPEPIVIRQRQKNLMWWFIDQMKHSGKFWNTDLCQQAVQVAQKCIDGDYNSQRRRELFDTFFEATHVEEDPTDHTARPMKKTDDDKKNGDKK